MCYYSRWIKITNNHDNGYGAIIMTKVIARVYPARLMYVDWAPGGGVAASSHISVMSYRKMDA